MKTRILVPLDGSALAERALPCALTLARGLPAQLILFRAISVAPDLEEVVQNADLEVEIPRQRIKTEALDYLDSVASRLDGEEPGVYTVVRWGPAAEAILDYAEQNDIDQIVMATHGYGGISRWVHGSVAERVLQSAQVPVLLVRAREEVSRDPEKAMVCRRVLIPLDGSPVAEQVLGPVIPIARALGPEIVLFRVPIVHVFGSFTGDWYLPQQGILETAREDAQAYLDRVAGDLKAQGLEVSTAMRIGAVAESIIDYAQINQIDLIAMCTHGRTGLARWTLGSVADRVLRAGHIPLFLVRAQ